MEPQYESLTLGVINITIVVDGFIDYLNTKYAVCFSRSKDGFQTFYILVEAGLIVFLNMQSVSFKSQ